MQIRKAQLDGFAETQRRNRLVSLAEKFVTDPSKDRIDPKTGQVTLEDSRGNKTLLNITDQGLAGIKTPAGRQFSIDRDEKGRIAAIRAPDDGRLEVAYNAQDALSDVFLNEKSLIHLDYSEDDRSIDATFADGARELLQYQTAPEIWSGRLTQLVARLNCAAMIRCGWSSCEIPEDIQPTSTTMKRGPQSLCDSRTALKRLTVPTSTIV